MTRECKLDSHAEGRFLAALDHHSEAHTPRRTDGEKSKLAISTA